MKKTFALLLAMAMTLTMTACTKEEAPAPAPSEPEAPAVESTVGGKEGGTSLNFTTGGDQGTYYGFGGVIAGKVGETTSTKVTAITSGGSKANIEAMDAGDAPSGASK